MTNKIFIGNLIVKLYVAIGFYGICLIGIILLVPVIGIYNLLMRFVYNVLLVLYNNYSYLFNFKILSVLNINNYRSQESKPIEGFHN